MRRPVAGEAEIIRCTYQAGPKVVVPDEIDHDASRQGIGGIAEPSGQGEAAMTNLKEAARRFASVDGGDAPRPEIWTLVEW